MTDADQTPVHPGSILTEEAVRRLAGPRVYDRGVRYCLERRVRSLAEYDGVVTASVHGRRDYTVRLWAEDGGIAYSCTCPMGAQDGFCKHCVAVALAVLMTGRAGGDRPEMQGGGLTMEDVQAHLARQEKDTLVSLLMQEAMKSEDLRRRLLIRAAKDRPEGLDMSSLYTAINEALFLDGFLHHRDTEDYLRGVGSVVASLRELLGEARAAEALELIEYALRRAEDAIQYVGDSGDDMAGILMDLQEMHHAACVQAKPEPEELAEKLFQWELESEWNTFGGAVETYGPILGDAGLARYRELAEAEWRKVAPLSPGQDAKGGVAGWRSSIAHIMEALARAAGDVDALVEVMARDLSTPRRFLRIAEVCKEAGRHDEALRWGERGIEAFPERTDSRLRDFLAEEYQARGLHDEGMRLIWAEFADYPNLGTYRELKDHADRCRQWSSWREKALAHVRRTLAEAMSVPPKDGAGWHKPAMDNSILVEILLWEGDAEAAWEEAQAGGCNNRLWMELAEKREESHPEDSLGIYRRMVEPVIDRTKADAYREAVRLLRRVHHLLSTLDRKHEFQEYVESLRSAYRRKRNFIRLLDAEDWG